VIVTAEQAAALPGPFVVDGDIHASSPDESRVAPPWAWADLDRPCHYCRGWGVLPASQVAGDPECGICHGTGRRTVELEVKVAERYGFSLDPLGLFTIQVETLRHLAGTPSGRYAVIATKVED